MKKIKNKFEGFTLKWSSKVHLNYGVTALIDTEREGIYIMGEHHNWVLPLSFESIKKLYKAVK